MRIFYFVLIAFAMVFCFCGCERVVETDSMIVYGTRTCQRSQHWGKYFYYVRDGKGGFILFTDKKYEMGDKLAIVKVEK